MGEENFSIVMASCGIGTTLARSSIEGSREVTGLGCLEQPGRGATRDAAHQADAKRE
jgi:hypothetical protein